MKTKKLKWLCWLCSLIIFVLSGIPYVSYLYVRNKVLAHHSWTHVQPDDVVLVGWMGLLGHVQGAGLELAVYLDNPGGTVYIPSGTYAAPATLKSQINLIGAGRGQAEVQACPTTLTFNSASGTALAITNMNHIYIANMCIKYTGAGTTAVAIKLGWGQFVTLERLYIQGAWGIGINEVPVEGSGTTGYNAFRDIHMTGFAASGIGCKLDSTAGTNQTVNNNYFDNVNCMGGTGGIGLNIVGGNLIVNEIIVKGGQFTATTGTGILIANSSARDFVCIGCDVEGSSQGVTVGTGNTGTFISSNLSANGNNSAAANVVDNSAGGMRWLENNIAGIAQVWQVSTAGDVKVNSLCVGGAGCNGSNTISIPSGGQLLASGTATIQFDNTDTQFLKPIDWLEQAAPAGIAGRARCYSDSTTHALTCSYNNGTFGGVPLINAAQTWSANQTSVPLVTPTIGGGSTLNLYKTATDSPGNITVNAQTCTDRGVAVAGLATTAVIMPTANYALEANLSLSAGQTVAGTAHYRICNGTAGNITLNAASTFNLAILQ